MKIIIDARCVGKRMHGIARYTLNLIRHLTEIDRESIFHILHTPEVSPSLFANSENIETTSVNLKLYSLNEQLLLPGIIKRIAPDLYHSPTFSAPVIQNCPTLMTIHDMIHLTGPTTALSLFHRLYYSFIVKKAALRAKKVITVSEFSKGEISRILGIPPHKIEVTYNGIDDPFFREGNRGKEDSRLEPGYWLFVGNEKPHKNVVSLVRAYSLTKRSRDTLPPLVLVGVSKEGLLRLLPPDKIDGVLFLKVDSDNDLLSAYRRASIFIAPSLEEGFGFPVLEAMAAGTPVITSDIPVLKEITRGACVLVNPRNEEALSEAMLRVHGDEPLKKSLRESGVLRAKSFTLKETARRTLNIYRGILNDA